MLQIISQCSGVVPRFVGKMEWRILPVGEVYDQPAACQGGVSRDLETLCERIEGLRGETAPGVGETG